MVPALRIRTLNHAPPRADGRFVLYWMIANRRTSWNFALDRALEHTVAHRVPLLVLEALRVDYPWASDRFHQFAIDGMRDNAARLAAARVAYYPYLEPSVGAGRGLLEALAAEAAVVVTDDYPCFFLPRMTAVAAERIGVQMEAVDANGLLPLRAVAEVFPTAYAFRRVLQRLLPSHIDETPSADPLASPGSTEPYDIPAHIRARWPAAALAQPGSVRLDRFPIDHRVEPVELRGGSIAARERLDAFVAEALPRYASDHSHPDLDVTSRLSPYLHWGHISVHEVFDLVMRRGGWMGTFGRRATGAKEGWWGVSPDIEAFLDELVTWREVGFNMSSKRSDYDQYGSLPPWALRTLAKHAADPREAPTPSTISTPPAPATSCGTPRSASSCARGASTTTSVCCGGSESWSGRQHLKRRST